MITGVFSYVLKHPLGQQTVVEQTVEDRVAILESLVSRTRPRAMAVFGRPDTMKARD
jgi:hypothetical protein